MLLGIAMYVNFSVILGWIMAKMHLPTVGMIIYQYAPWAIYLII